MTSPETTTSPAPAYISLENISHAYKEGEREHEVLQEINLQVNRGEKIALLGRSGSGKSTLLNLISGIDYPHQGNVVIDGTDLTVLNENDRTLYRRQHIGFIYQFFNLVPTLTAQENVAFVLELNGVAQDQALERSRAVLQALGMDSQLQRFPSRLSGGEQQRVAIARAIVHRPKIILADEPTGNLDAATGESVLAALQDMLGEQGSTLFMVTHSLAVAKTADRIITLEDGKLQDREGDFAW